MSILDGQPTKFIVTIYDADEPIAVLQFFATCIVAAQRKVRELVADMGDVDWELRKAPPSA